MPLRLLVLLTGYILVPLMHQLRRRRRRGRIFFKSIFYGAIKIKTPKISSTTLFKNQSGNAAPIPPTSKNFSLSSSSSSLSLSLCLFLSSRECHKHNLNSLSLSYTFAPYLLEESSYSLTHSKRHINPVSLSLFHSKPPFFSQSSSLFCSCCLFTYKLYPPFFLIHVLKQHSAFSINSISFSQMW